MASLEETISESREEFHTALVFAYRNVPTLTRMLKFKMDFDLVAEIAVGPITDMIFDLIDRFEGDGRLAAG